MRQYRPLQTQPCVSYRKCPRACYGARAEVARPGLDSFVATNAAMAGYVDQRLQDALTTVRSYAAKLRDGYHLLTNNIVTYLNGKGSNVVLSRNQKPGPNSGRGRAGRRSDEKKAQQGNGGKKKGGGGSRKNRKARRRAELDEKRAKREKAQRTPGGDSKYARKQRQKRREAAAEATTSSSSSSGTRPSPGFGSRSSLRRSRETETYLGYTVHRDSMGDKYFIDGFGCRRYI